MRSLTVMLPYREHQSADELVESVLALCGQGLMRTLRAWRSAMAR